MGYKYGDASNKVRATLHPKMRLIVDRLIKYIDVSLVYGYRSNELQLELWAKGRELNSRGGDKWTKNDWLIIEPSQVVTKAFPGESNHNTSPSPAVDLAPYPINFENKAKKIARFYYVAGMVKVIAAYLDIKIRWGGDWDGDNDFDDQTFDDLMHFELAKDEY